MITKTETERRLDMALTTIGNLQMLVIDVYAWINSGYVETASKHINEMQANGWEKAGWKELHSAMYDKKATP